MFFKLLKNTVMKINLFTLGLVGKPSKSGEDSLHPSEFIGFMPTFVVRDINLWIEKFAKLGIYPFSTKEGVQRDVVMCSNNGGFVCQLVSASGRNLLLKKVDKHGLYISRLTFFCKHQDTPKKALEIAKSVWPEIKNKTWTNCTIFSPYEDMEYKFLCKDNNNFTNHFLIRSERKDDPGIDIKIDHIVQNVDGETYNLLCDFFSRLGMQKTFDGAETVEFKTNAFSPANGIFDKLAFFAINTGTVEGSQIKWGMREHGGSFVQHIALHSNNFIKTAKIMKKIGMPVMGTKERPDMSDYYERFKSLFEETFPKDSFEEFVKVKGYFDADCPEAIS